MKKIIFLILFPMAAINAFCQFTTILLDYDAVDEIAATDSGGVYDREFWQVNSNFPDADTIRGLAWAVVKFDSLYDADSFMAYSFSDKALIIDSIAVRFTHQNVSETPDTILVSVYQFEGINGLELDSFDNITNMVLYDTTIITSTSLTAFFQVGTISLHPALQLSAGEKFLVGVHFYGDLLNNFSLLTGYTDFCGGACFDPSASPSVFSDNSYYKIIYWDGPVSFSGVNSLVFDCDGDLNPGEPEECELSSIQNIGIAAYVSFMSDTSVSTRLAEIPLFKVYPNPAEGIVFIQLFETGSEVHLSLTDTKGAQLLHKTYANVSSRQLKLDVSDLSAGLYFLMINDNRQKTISKLVKN